MTRLHRSNLIFVVHPKCPNAWSDWKLARRIPQDPRKVKLATANLWPACADVSSPPSFFTFKISKRTASRASWSRSISPSLASINIASVSFCCSWSEWFCAWFVVLLRIKSTNSSCLSSPFKSVSIPLVQQKKHVHSKLRHCVLFELVINWCFSLGSVTPTLKKSWEYNFPNFELRGTPVVPLLDLQVLESELEVCWSQYLAPAHRCRKAEFHGKAMWKNLKNRTQNNVLVEM